MKNIKEKAKKYCSEHSNKGCTEQCDGCWQLKQALGCEQHNMETAYEAGANYAVDLLIAEIKKLNDEAKMYLSDFDCGRLSICKELMNFLDTFEVKEVDLKREVEEYIRKEFTSAEPHDEFLTTVMQLDDMVLFAKHFYELGINSKK